MTDETPNDPPERDSRDAARAVDPLDERLSAAIDGVAGSDAESGPDGIAADAHTGGAGTAGRLRALEAARDILAIPPPRLDDLTRRRMLRAAVAAAPNAAARRGDRRRASRAVAVAALVAVVAGVGWMLTSLNHSSSTQSRAATASTAPTRSDLHEVSNPQVLKSRVEAALRAGASPVASGLGDSTTTVAPAPNVADSSARGIAGTGAPEVRCLSTVRVPAGSTPNLLGTATFHGEPALVVVARDQSRTLVFVLATVDCRLLTSQFLKQ